MTLQEQEVLQIPQALLDAIYEYRPYPEIALLLEDWTNQVYDLGLQQGRSMEQEESQKPLNPPSEDE